MTGTRTFHKIGFVLIGFGLASLFALIGRPTIAGVRMVDIVHLIGTGMCFGGAIVALVAHARGGQNR